VKLRILILSIMGRIIHCSDLILRINETTFQEQEAGNLTEWILLSTEYKPLKPETCEIRDELDSHQKIVVIVMIWSFLIFLSIFYCYFCEQKLFPSQKLFDTCLVDRSGFLDNGRCPNKECNTKNRFSMAGLYFKSPYQQLHKSSSDLARSFKKSDSDLSFGEFRLLTSESVDNQEGESLLKRRHL